MSNWQLHYSKLFYYYSKWSFNTSVLQILFILYFTNRFPSINVLVTEPAAMVVVLFPGTIKNSVSWQKKIRLLSNSRPSDRKDIRYLRFTIFSYILVLYRKTTKVDFFLNVNYIKWLIGTATANWLKLFLQKFYNLTWKYLNVNYINSLNINSTADLTLQWLSPSGSNILVTRMYVGTTKSKGNYLIRNLR